MDMSLKKSFLSKSISRNFFFAVLPTFASCHTVWKFQNFPAIQILREINFSLSHSVEITVNSLWRIYAKNFVKVTVLLGFT